MQAGYASGLLLICPLGDIFPRRPFILALVTFTATLVRSPPPTPKNSTQTTNPLTTHDHHQWLPLTLTTSLPLFQAFSLLTGLTTVTPQLLLPLVGDLAPPHRRASCLAVLVSGLSLGVLLARLLGGVMAESESVGWRGIYWFGFAVQWVVVAALWGWMPDYPSKNPGGGFQLLSGERGGGGGGGRGWLGGMWGCW
jgi:MFS family permease